MLRRATTSISSGVAQRYGARALRQNRSAGSVAMGIDLGTTISVGTLWKDKKAVPFQSSSGSPKVPSVVAFKKDGEILVGEKAKRQQSINPKNTFYACKRLIGRRFSEETIQEDIHNVGYAIVENTNGDACVADENGEKYSPSVIASHVLREIAANAARANGDEPVTEAVVTVPAYFNDSQRQATKDAGKIAGLNVQRIINEPTAAALSYGMNKNQSNHKIAVYDLGGGTFDITIMELDEGVFEVKATNGDTHLGGEDFDMKVQEYLGQKFSESSGISVGDFNATTKSRLRASAEEAKITLSNMETAKVSIPFLQDKKNFEVELTKEKLEELTADLLKRTEEPCRKCLKDAGLMADDISEVVLVGGMSRMPKVVQTAQKIFSGKKPYQGENPDEAVAKGAAIQAGVLQGEMSGMVLVDVVPLSLGLEVKGGQFARIIPRNTKIPVKKTQSFTTVEDNQTSVTINVFQGERDFVEGNNLLGKFDLVGLPAQPKGVSKLKVSFDVDANGILQVSAMDEVNKTTQTIRINSPTGLSEEEIQRQVLKAEAQAASDKERKDLIMTKDAAEVQIAAAERSVEEFPEQNGKEKDAMIKASEKLQEKLDNELTSAKELKDMTSDLQNKVSAFARSTQREEKEDTK